MNDKHEVETSELVPVQTEGGEKLGLPPWFPAKRAEMAELALEELMRGRTCKNPAVRLWARAVFTRAATRASRTSHHG